MPSPFPGMDPYIEACYLWDDFHHNLISGIQNALRPVLPKHYVVRAGERSYAALTTKNGVDEYRVQADVGVLRKPGEAPTAAPAAATAVLETPDADSTPVTMRAMVRTEFREGFLEIREVHGDRQVVTAIEVLSPSTNASAAKVGSNTFTSGRPLSPAWSISWRSTFSATAAACPWTMNGPTAPIACWSAGRPSRPVVPFGAPTPRDRCRRSPFPCAARRRSTPVPPAANRRHLRAVAV